jgi:alkylhydroperoxidase family enzyme
VAVPNEEQLHRELAVLLASTRNGELTPTDFAARLDSLDSRFLGEGAHTPAIVERRRAAVAAYDQLTSGKELDTHHHLEVLAEVLGVDLPRHPDGL